MLNTRSGKGITASAELEQEVRRTGGVWIEAPLTPEQKQIPMNWVLSTQSMNRIQTDIKDKLKPSGKLLSTFFRNDITYMALKR